MRFHEGRALADDSDNRCDAIETYAEPLGNVVVAGESITGSARTEGGDLAYKRTYEDDPLYAAVTGYASQACAPTQPEGIYQDLLNGTDDEEAGTERIVSSSTAGQPRSAMRTVVDEGTGSNARLPGAAVGGRTGTTQHGENNSRTPYARSTSYAEADPGGKEVAVAVVVERSDAVRSEVGGNGPAAPVARAAMEAAPEDRAFPAGRPSVRTDRPFLPGTARHLARVAVPRRAHCCSASVAHAGGPAPDLAPPRPVAGMRTPTGQTSFDPPHGPVNDHCYAPETAPVTPVVHMSST